MSELKPCPFCGGEAEVYSYEAERDIFDSRSLGYVDTEYYDMWGCWCKACAAMIPEKRTEAEAIEAWNARYERTVTLKDNGHCPDCNRLVGSGERYCAYCGARVKEKPDA